MDGIRGTSVQDSLTKVAALVHGYYPSKIVCEARADSLFPGQVASVLARRGYPMLVEPVQSGARKGERILDALSTPLADNRLVLLESVVSGTNAMETIKQITHATADGRSLPHDDRIDALAWAVSSIAQFLIGDEADSLRMEASLKLEELFELPLRKGGITPNSMEAQMFKTNESEQRLQWKLDRALEKQQQELRRGIVDEAFGKYIEKLQAEVAKLRPRHTYI